VISRIPDIKDSVFSHSALLSSEFPMRELHLDLETYSDVDLKKYGVYPYSASPNFRILMMSWAFDDDPVQVAIGDLEIWEALGDVLTDPNVIKIAHNAQFERVCLSRWLGMPHDELLPVEEWHDTAAVAAQRGYPRKLMPLSLALGGEKKDEAGTRLINMFCVPQAKFHHERAYLPSEKPEDWAAFLEYNRQDTVTSRDVHRRLGWFPTERERDIYRVDQRINDRGIKFDRTLAEAAEEETEENYRQDGEELIRITGVSTAGALQQIRDWLATKGVDLPDMKAETIEAALEQNGMDPQARRVLVLRQNLALVAVKKFGAALEAGGEDDRLRGQFMYHGAHTGRWTGRSVQLHNMPREQFEKKDEHGEKKPDYQAMSGAVLDLLMGFPANTLTMKKLVRSMLLLDGSVVDYASIEARVIAWLFDELWALTAFRGGRDIYVETAKMMATALGRATSFTRSEGKVAVLALGFQGSINSLRVMGARGKDEELLQIVRGWRAANENIVDGWAAVGQAFMKGGKVGRFINIEADGQDRRITLPSGRAIEYHGYKTVWVDTLYGRKAAPSFIDPQKGIRTRTYGGRLTENIVQGVARDVLADALVRLDREGLRPVGHVHDEALCENRDLDRVMKVMLEQPDWAPGLPIDGAGFTTYRYMKGV
jgi:DNA polymerase